jgi:hypothetical protein
MGGINMKGTEGKAGLWEQNNKGKRVTIKKGCL